jgi:hypothetical protein
MTNAPLADVCFRLDPQAIETHSPQPAPAIEADPDVNMTNASSLPNVRLSLMFTKVKDLQIAASTCC